MKSLAALFFGATVIFSVLHRIFPEEWLLSTAISCGTAWYHFAMRLLVGALVPPALTASSWFRPHKWEASLYRLLRVKHWKKHLPTYDPRQFSLKENTREQVLSNMRSAEAVHEIIMLCSFLPALKSR